MGELAVSATPEEELVSIGLGSCVGVALVDAVCGVAGLAHVMLPEANAAYSAPAKFADRAIPALVAGAERLGARRTRLSAVLVGGAQMFGGTDRAAASGLDLGMRNEAAVRAALEQERIPVQAAATGGNRGRTVRVLAGVPRVTVKEAGGAEVELWTSVATPNDVPQALGWVREGAA